MKLALIPLVFLIGCSAKVNKDIETFEQNKSEIAEADATVIARFDQPTEFQNSEKVTFSFYELSTKKVVEFQSENGWEIQKIPSGVYWLGTAKQKKGFTPLIWNDLKIYFEINKGDVAYIGDFSFDSTKGTLEQSYDIEALKSTLIQKNPEVIGKIKQIKVNFID